MAENSKLKILRLLEIMRKTDEAHPINSTQIAERLRAEGIHAERKAIARDITCLEDAGYSIIKCENQNLGWYMTDQMFEDYELKILVDAVASAKFITIDDTRNLIKRIRSLATTEGEQLIKSTTVLDPNVKITDGKFKFKFDMLIRAITDKKKVSFQYFEITKGGKRVLRRDGHTYVVSPHYIVIQEDEYFLIGNPASHNHATHFKVEMMTNLKILSENAKPMDEIEELANKTISEYLRQNIKMWTGEPETVKIRCSYKCRRDLMMEFGSDITVLEQGDDNFTAVVKVNRNEGFYRWLSGFGNDIVIESPDFMRDEFVKYLEAILKTYKQKEDD